MDSKALAEIESIEDVYYDYKTTKASELAKSLLEDGLEEDAKALLKHDNRYIRNGAAEGVTKYYTENNRWNEVKELLQSNDNEIWRGAYWAFYNFIISCESIDKLRALRRTIENLLENSKGSRPLNVQVQYDEIFELVRDIDNKSNLLMKNQLPTLGWNNAKSAKSVVKTNEVAKKNKLKY